MAENCLLIQRSDDNLVDKIQQFLAFSKTGLNSSLLDYNYTLISLLFCLLTLQWNHTSRVTKVLMPFSSAELV